MQSQSQGVSPPQLCSCQTSCTIAARQDSALPAPARYSGWAQGSSRDPQAALPSPDGLCLSPGVISFGLLGKIYSALSKLPVTAGHYVELDLQVEPCPVFHPCPHTAALPPLLPPCSLQNSPFPSTFIDWLLQSKSSPSASTGIPTGACQPEWGSCNGGHSPG